MRTNTSTAAGRTQKIHLSLDGSRQSEMCFYKVNSVTCWKNRIVCFPLQMESNTESKRVCASGCLAGFGLVLVLFRDDTQSALCLNWELLGDSGSKCWVEGVGLCVNVCLGSKRAAFSIVSGQALKGCWGCGDVEGGRQNQRENSFFLFFCWSFIYVLLYSMRSKHRSF